MIDQPPALRTFAWMTTEDLASHLDVLPGIAQRRALQSRWTRQKGPGGVMRWAVPLAAITAPASSSTVHQDGAGEASEGRPDVAGGEDPAHLLAALLARVEAWESASAETRRLFAEERAAWAKERDALRTGLDKMSGALSALCGATNRAAALSTVHQDA